MRLLAFGHLEDALAEKRDSGRRRRKVKARKNPVFRPRRPASRHSVRNAFDRRRWPGGADAGRTWLGEASMSSPPSAALLTTWPNVNCGQIGARSMEIFRLLAVADKLRASGT
jgi:hypothetical protein